MRAVIHGPPGPRASHGLLKAAVLVLCVAATLGGRQLHQTEPPPPPLVHLSSRHPGFYTLRDESHLYEVAQSIPELDKFTPHHHYELMYTKYFEKMHGRHHVKKFLEIGLGCRIRNVQAGGVEGVGKSAHFWRAYWGPDVEIWEGEFDADCVAKYKHQLDELNIKAVTGDQSDTDTLHRWVTETGGGFDVIIDDGGHYADQQYNSFVTLFTHALKPGGVYFIEDLLVGHEWVSKDLDIIEVIKSWMDALVWNEKGAGPPLKYKPPPDLVSVDCMEGVCAFTKCFSELREGCISNNADPSLINYSSKGSENLAPGK